MALSEKKVANLIEREKRQMNRNRHSAIFRHAQEEDWATWNFTQWFVKEQAEEEPLVLSLLDKIKIAGGINAKDDALYSLKRDRGRIPDEVKLAQDATTDNP